LLGLLVGGIDIVLQMVEAIPQGIGPLALGSDGSLSPIGPDHGAGE
jgi:hypothetical protein